MRTEIKLPDGEIGILMIDFPLREESGQVLLRRWGNMIGAKTTSVAQLYVGPRRVIHMDLIPREAIVDGFTEGIYSETEQRLKGCIIGGLLTDPEFRGRGYTTLFLNRIKELLTGKVDLIFNFVLDERLSYFEERGWQEVDPDVKVTIEQPGGAVPLPEQFHLVLFPLVDNFEMPKDTFECLGLPA